MCCDGVMFHGVKLQPKDSTKALAGFGLRIRRKRGSEMFLQPCAAFKGCRCAIYEDRPERCRLFECKQLKQMIAGEISEAAALERVASARAAVTRVMEILHHAGDKNSRRCIAERCDGILEKSPAVFPELADYQQPLRRAQRELEEILATDFRIEPAQTEDGTPTAY